MTAAYVEFEPYAAAWLENLIAAGHIAPGKVFKGDLRDISPDELAGFTQVHLCAGIGVWSAALRAAGWPDDRPAWTASFPCQPFSAAGRGGGFADERHLWPAGHYLIGECRPPVVFGEQVASKDGLAWLDLVQADLEGLGYACGSVPFPAAAVGAPHGRLRNYFVARRGGGRAPPHDPGPQGRAGMPERADQRAARPDGVAGLVADASDAGQQRRRSSEAGDGGSAPRVEPERLLDARGVALPHSRQRGRIPKLQREPDRAARGRDEGDRRAAFYRSVGVLADDDDDGRAARRRVRPLRQEHDNEHGGAAGAQRPGPVNGFWRDVDWLLCRDGKWRPTQPSLFPLVDGSAFKLGSGSPLEGKSRAGILRAAGNAIVLQAAQAFIESYLEIDG